MATAHDVLVVRPYGRAVRERVFAALDRSGHQVTKVIPEGTSDADAVGEVLRSPHRILLVPFHGHRGGDGQALHGIAFLEALAAEARHWRWTVLMPVTRFAGAAYSLTMGAATGPFVDSVHALPMGDLDDRELARQIQQHLGTFARGA